MRPRIAILSVLLSSIWAPATRGDDWVTLYGAARTDSTRVSGASLAVALTPKEWSATEQERRRKWREMLGLDPLPPRTPLNATVTGMLDRGDYVVEKIHFESVPGGHVAGNLYRPANIKGRLPAVLYLCGHTKGKVNKPYQANPRWFGQHGYVCLVLDPIQLGESQGFHHGTFREDRWDWPSRGYTPAGTEVWNAMRALDYLQSRADVDPQRLGATGLSGGGVVSWCLAAADPRIKAVAPVCQSGSIEQVVTDRGVEGHCDCAFWINYHRWCWPDIGALIAPRALLIAAGSEDVLWRPYGYRQVAHRIRKQYETLDAQKKFDLVEDLTPHGYTPKLRRAVFRWFNTHLKDDPSPVNDDITDFVEPEENLLVFGGDLPENDTMQAIDRTLVGRRERPHVADEASWRKHQRDAVEKLRETTFRHTTDVEGVRLRDFRSDGRDRSGGTYGTFEFKHPDSMTLAIKTRHLLDADAPVPTLVFAMPPASRRTFSGGGSSRPRVGQGIATAAVEVRNTGATSVGPGYLWNARRTYPLLGHTLPERQVSDLLAAVSVLRTKPVHESFAVYGEGWTAPLAIYAALLDPDISEVVLADCPTTHEDPQTPEFLGILRVGDLPHNLALLYPRPITYVGELPEEFVWTQQLYEQLGAGNKFRVVERTRQWQPER